MTRGVSDASVCDGVYVVRGGCLVCVVVYIGGGLWGGLGGCLVFGSDDMLATITLANILAKDWNFLSFVVDVPV